MKGKDAIIEQILSDAKAVANSTLEEANASSAEILSVASNDADIYRAKNMSESYAEREEIVRRKITVANLEVKKLILKAKQSRINDAFDKAVAEIKADKKAYLKLLANMLRFAEEGETVTVAKADAKTVTKEFIDKTCESYGVKVKFNKTHGDFAGGLVISGEGSDKNLTLEVELKAIREESEPEIAKILFGD